LKPLQVIPGLPVLLEGYPRLRRSIFFRFPDTKFGSANQDFVRRHTDLVPTTPLDTWVWDHVPHQSYNPDLFFPTSIDEPKTCLQGRRFSSDDIVESEIRKWLGDHDDFFYSFGLENFFVSYNKWFKTFGDHVEKPRTGNET
jgi:hypothetical protein